MWNNMDYIEYNMEIYNKNTLIDMYVHLKRYMWNTVDYIGYVMAFKKNKLIHQ